MTLRTLQKWHGAGNDFLVDVIGAGANSSWTAARARAVCARTSGVGADGLLVATLGDPLEMVLFNADGTTAEMSGNGIRCLAAGVRRSTKANWDSLEVLTGAGMRTVTIEMDGDAGYASVAMGPVTFGEIIEGTLGVAYVGNPHIVVLDDPRWTTAQREEMAGAWSSQVGGANVEFVSVLSQSRVQLRVIERGVGWTMACGTGSCASVAVLHREGLCASDVVVDNPGGPLHVVLDDGSATLGGPVQFVATVEWLGT